MLFKVIYLNKRPQLDHVGTLMKRKIINLHVHPISIIEISKKVFGVGWL